jgi:hypothetical protein
MRYGHLAVGGRDWLDKWAATNFSADNLPHSP